MVLSVAALTRRGPTAAALLVLFLLAGLPGLAAAAGPPQHQTSHAPRFDRDVAPILKAKCIHCHGSARKRAELDLSTPEGVMRGGESGPIVKPGNAKESLLHEVTHEGRMPPKKTDRLSKADVETIRRW